MGTSAGSLVKLNASGQYLTRRLNDLDKQQYDSWKELYDFTVGDILAGDVIGKSDQIAVRNEYFMVLY